VTHERALAVGYETIDLLYAPARRRDLLARPEIVQLESHDVFEVLQRQPASAGKARQGVSLLGELVVDRSCDLNLVVRVGKDHQIVVEVHEHMAFQEEELVSFLLDMYPCLAVEDVAGDLVSLAARDNEVRNPRLVGCHPPSVRVP
jgi:hypothetical protein